MEQMTIFDIFYPERINPVREVAKKAGPYWTTSRQKLIKFCQTDPDIKVWARVVKHHYSPYGFAGHFGGDFTPNTLEGWNMLTNHISVTFWNGAGEHQEMRFSWEDFAREVADMIWSGEYGDM